MPVRAIRQTVIDLTARGDEFLGLFRHAYGDGLFLFEFLGIGEERPAPAAETGRFGECALR